MRTCFFIALTIAILIGLAGCVGQQAEESAGLGEPFSLAVGQSASVKGEELSIKFLEVAADSRCPKGATCVWQGEVTGLVEITRFKSVLRLTLTQPGLTQEQAKAEFEGYELKFDIQPYPELGKEIKPTDYRLQLMLTKK